jgi:hypothetical protein
LYSFIAALFVPLLSMFISSGLTLFPLPTISLFGNRFSSKAIRQFPIISKGANS